MAPEMNTHAVENLSLKNAEKTRIKRTEKNAKSRLTTSGYEHQHAGTSCSEISPEPHSGQMAAGKLTSRFEDGNSSAGGTSVWGPFGGGYFRFLSWSPFLLLPSTPHL